MARQVTEKVYADFRKGWLQDQHPLQQPEGTVEDINNFDISKDGTIAKRKGLEPKSVASVSGIIKSATEIHRWDNVNGDPNINFIVVYMVDTNQEAIFDIYEASPSTASEGVGAYLGRVTTNKQYANSGDTQDNKLSVTTAMGKLFYAHPQLGIGYITFSEDSSTFFNFKYVLEIRDTLLWETGSEGIDGIEHRGGRYISPIAEYNLRNSGWGDKPTKCTQLPYEYKVHNTEFAPIPYYKYEFRTEHGLDRWPKLSELYHMSKSGGGNNVEQINAFNPNQFKNDYTGNTVPPLGKYIVRTDQFYRTGYKLNGDSHSSMAEKSNSAYPRGCRERYDLTESPSKIAFYAGRLWYAGNGTYTSQQFFDSYQTKEIDARSTIYYSQTLQNNLENSTKCYQQNDPTAETINQVLATDGGTLSFKEIGRIEELVTLGSFLYVVADNGIWRISGKDYNSFSADSYSIEKVSNVGVLSTRGVTSSEEILFALTEVGILAIASQGATGPATVTNLTENKINTFYKQFSKKVLKNVRVSYDFREKKLVILAALPGQEEVTDSFYRNKPNTVLFYDMELGFFYKYSFTPPEDAEFIVSDLFLTEGSVTVTTRDYMVDSLDERYTDSSGEDYWIPGTSSFVETLKRLGLFVVNPSDSLDILTFTGDIDYEDDFGYGAPIDYSSNMSVGFDSIGSLIADKKQAPYVLSYLERPYKIDAFGNKTYGGFVAISADEVGLEIDASCQLRHSWDHKTLSSLSELFRYNRSYTPAGANDPFNYGQDVIKTKNRIRGKGTSLNLEIVSPAGKACFLEGIAIQYVGEERG